MNEIFIILNDFSLIKMGYSNATDILRGIFAYFPEENRKFYYNPTKVHKFLHDHKLLSYSILESLMFDTNGNTPICEKIDEAHFSLILSGLLEWDGLRYNKVSEACKAGFEGDISKKFSKKQIEELKELSEKFQKEFSLKQTVN